MDVRKAVIPAAGMGTRLYPLTRAQPKEMLPVLDKPVIHYVVEEAVRSGLDEILIIVGKEKEAIINYFDKSKLDEKFEGAIDDFPEIFFVRQKEPLGLGDSIRYSRKFVDDEPFVVLLGDTIHVSNSRETSVEQLLRVFNRKESPVISLEKVSRDKIKDYGIVEGREIEKNLWLVKDAVEKPDPKDAPSDMGIVGTYVFTPNVYDYLEKIKPGRRGEYQLTDAIKMMCSDVDVYGYKFEGKRYDIGTKELWIKAFIDFAKQSKEFSKFL